MIVRCSTCNQDVQAHQAREQVRWDGEPEWLMFCSTCHQEQP